MTTQSNLLGANLPIRGYTNKSGTYAPAAAVPEFVDFIKSNITVPFVIQYPESDLQVVSLQADQANSSYTVAVTDLQNLTYFQNTYTVMVFDPAWLLVPAGHKLTITPISNISKLRIITQPIAILDQVYLP